MNRVDSPPLKNQKFANHSGAVSGNTDRGNSGHYVQFYETEKFLVKRVAEFVAAAFETDDAGILIATPGHRSAVERELSKQGFPIEELTSAGRYFSIDAKGMLSQFMTGDSADEKNFHREIGALLDKASSGRRRHVQGFGEMVALLCAEK